MNQINWIKPTPNFFQNLDVNKFYLVEELVGSQKSTNHNDIKILRELSNSEYITLAENSKNLYQFEYLQRKQKEVSYNLEDFYRTYEEYNNKISAVNAPVNSISDIMTDIFININRTFINYLNSARILIEHLESNLIHKYKSKSEEVKNFKSHTSYIFDTYFSYRFMYKLRNYAEHCNYPIYRINSQKEWLNPSESIPLNLWFGKFMLLQNKSYFNGQLMQDLKGYNELFPVFPIIEDFEKHLKSIIDNFIINNTLLPESS